MTIRRLAPGLALALVAAPWSARAETVEDAVQAADLSMARAVSAHDAAAFAEHLDADAIFASPGGIALGRDAVVAAWRRYLTAGGPTLTWRPARAIAASSGDVAVTTGTFTWQGTLDGSPAQVEGEYVTAWRRDASGRWKVTLDASLEPAAALGPGLARKPLRRVSSAAGDLEATLGTWTRGEEEGVYLLVSHNAGDEATVAVDSAFALRKLD